MLPAFPGSVPGAPRTSRRRPNLVLKQSKVLLIDQSGQANTLPRGLPLSEGGAAIQRSGHREGPGLLARPQGCAGLASETVSGAASLHTARHRRHLGLSCCSRCFYTRNCVSVSFFTGNAGLNTRTEVSRPRPLHAAPCERVRRD